MRYNVTMSDHSLSYSNPVLDLPPQMVLEVALGTDPVESVCARYGYEAEQVEYIRNSKYFWKVVREQEAELEKNGLSFKLRAKKVTEDMLGRLWVHAKTDAVPFAAKLDFMKTAAKLADLEPKATQAIPGTGFSITFNLGGTSASITQDAPIDVTPSADTATSALVASLAIPPREPSRIPKDAPLADMFDLVGPFPRSVVGANDELDYEETH